MIEINQKPCLGSCAPLQYVNFKIALNDISTIEIYNDENCKYDLADAKWSYSIDNACWSCDMDYNTILKNTLNLTSDFFVRVKVQGVVSSVNYNGSQYTNYSTQLVTGFNFTACNNKTSSNMFNPYANMDCAMGLYQQLSETVSCLFGLPCYYFKLSPNTKSKDITFKEYTLMDVESVKQIKIMVADGAMPSSKPDFTEFGLEWQSDWETEITKGTFATAFGLTAQPLEGDLVYIPMMKRMWQVSGSYEEKKDGFMWNATSFKVVLVKYQEKDSVNLGDTESLVSNFVKNKYEDLFGEDDNATLDSGEQSVESPKYAANSLYPVYESDATRKYVTCDSIDILDNSLYYKGTLIADSNYTFTKNDVLSTIIYQKYFCGNECSLSFIFNTLLATFESDIIDIGSIKVHIKQNNAKITLSINKDDNMSIELDSNQIYFVILRFSKTMNLVDFSVYKYVWNEKIPIYKLNSQHYWFDIDNPVTTYSTKHSIEFEEQEKVQVEIHNFYGWITNFKLFTFYNSNITELLQMYPTNQHLLINDTARKIVDLNGVNPA